MRIDLTKISEDLGVVDLLILSSGFESRSTLLSDSLDMSKIKCGYIFHLDEAYNVAENNLKKMLKLRPNFKAIIYPKNNAFDTFSSFRNHLESYVGKSFEGEKLNICVDITAFTREVLLIIIRIITLDYFKNKVNFKLIYTPAIAYKEDWLTKGVREIRPILGYSGLLSPSKKTLLVMLTGFEEERMHIIINVFEPNSILLGRPSKNSSFSSELHNISEKKYENIRDAYEHLIVDSGKDGFTFSCQDIKETRNNIISIFNKYNENYNIVIAPLNNKISTLGVAIAALDNEVIQIFYASANQYNIDNFSTPASYFCVYNLSTIMSR